MSDWYVYLVRTRLGTLYTGVAIDVARRLSEHESSGRLGAKYLRAKGPFSLAYQVKIGDKATAFSVERRIKKLPKEAKEEIVRSCPDADGLLGLLKVSA